MESDLSRTAIANIKNVLSHMSSDLVIRILEKMKPPVQPQSQNVQKTRDPPVSVFKELVRLFSEYSELEPVRKSFAEIWNRERLHKDVRIAMAQCLIGLLSEKTSEVREMAWNFLGSCVQSPAMVSSVGMVLVQVRGEPDKKVVVAGNFLSMPSVPTHVYQYGELATLTIPLSISDRYLTSVLMPLVVTLGDCIDKLDITQKGKDDVELVNMLKQAVKLFTDFIQPGNEERVAEFLRPIILSSAVAPADSHLSLLYPFLVHALLHCIVMSTYKSTTSVLPASWYTLLDLVVCLNKVFFDTSMPVVFRLLARSRFDHLKLNNLILPTQQLKSKVLKQEILSPITCLTTIPFAMDFYWSLLWQRSASILSADVSYLKSIANISNLEQEFINLQNSVLNSAEALMRDLVKKISTPAVHCMSELYFSDTQGFFKQIFSIFGSSSKFLERIVNIYESDDWCSDISEFSVWRTTFRLFLLKNVSGLTNGTRVSKILEFILQKERKFLRDSLVQGVVVEIFRKLISSHKEYVLWKKLNNTEGEGGRGGRGGKAGGGAQSKKEPEFDSAGLESMIKAFVNLGKTFLDSPNSDEEKLVASILGVDDLFFLQRVPTCVIPYLEKTLHPQTTRVWIDHVATQWRDPNTKQEISSDTVLGIPAVRKFLEPVIISVESADFSEQKLQMNVFRSCLSSSLDLMWYLFPQTCRNLFARTLTRGNIAFLFMLLQNSFGEVPASVFLQFLLMGRHDQFNLLPSEIPKSQIFGMALQKFTDDRGITSFVQTKESSERRKRLFSVVGVAEYFSEICSGILAPGECSSSASVESQERDFPLEKIIPQVRKELGGGLMESSLSHVGNFATSKLVCMNPYLYFQLVWEILGTRNSPVDRTTNPNFLVLKFKDLLDVEPQAVEGKKVVPLAIPILYLIDVARVLTEIVAPEFSKRGMTRVSNATYLLALEILEEIQIFSKERKVRNNVLEEVLLEGAVEKDGEMMIPGFWELVEKLSVVSNQRVMEKALGMMISTWRLRWQKKDSQ
eukprot:TRINITY_DN9183_c0_g3_i1.p1 TRINITY_DN9183_c0_g3~~TRINITY_DN9183_c0_g3_i1.p1  ORF type:complete len:1023 (-),score=213.59 TRINITY_DN9183_c0_g3_i1:179-3247(-)